MKRVRHPHGELIDLVWSSARPRPDTLPEKIKSHLSECEECRTFFEELKAVKQLTQTLPEARHVSLARVETAVASAMRSAKLRRHTLRETSRASLAPVKSMSPQEKGGFALTVLAALVANTALLRLLKPGGFLVLQGAANWLAPFAFYAVFHVRQKGHRKREEVTG